MSRDTPPIDIRPDHWVIVRGILQQHVPQYAVWAFGSRAKWTAKDYSDLDLCIQTEQPLDFKTLAKLQEDFAESDLPWKVDVVDGALISPAFRKIVERDKVVVQEPKQSLGMAGEWREASLAEIYEFDSGLSKPRSEFGSGYPFLSFKDVFYNSAVPKPLTELAQTTEQERARCSVKRGDVFLTRTSETMDELGMSSVALADIPDATFNGFTKRLRPKQERVIAPEFARYFFRSWKFRIAINAMSSMSTRASLNNEMLKRLTISFPSFEEQMAIGSILGTLDDKIELNRRMNQTLEDMARTLFKSWFVDFDGVAPQDMQESELGFIPKGWSWVPASELIEFNPAEPLRKGTLAPYLDMAALPTIGSWPEPPAQREFGSGMRFRNGDTLLARITPCLENGKTAFVRCLPEDAVAWGSTEFIVMRPKAPVPAEYAYLLARDSTFREHAIRSMTGTSGRQRVQADSVAAFKVASPPDEKIWKAFADFVAPLFKSIKANSETSETLGQLRDTLLPKLISGKFRIPNVATDIGVVA